MHQERGRRQRGVDSRGMEEALREGEGAQLEAQKQNGETGGRTGQVCHLNWMIVLNDKSRII